MLLGESVCYCCGSAALILLQVRTFGGDFLRFECYVSVLVLLLFLESELQFYAHLIEVCLYQFWDLVFCFWVATAVLLFSFFHSYFARI